MAKPKYTIGIVGGAGHVGLPLAITFAISGQKVLIYDTDQKTLKKIRGGRMPFMDRGAEPLLKRALAEKRLGLTSRAQDLAGVAHIIVTIGTPVDQFLNPDMKSVVECIDALLPYLSDAQTVILRSTVYPGVTQWIGDYLRSKGKNPKVAFCPERVVQGYAVEEIQKLPQIVSGTTKAAENSASALFRLCAPSVVRVSPMEAEFTKLFNNAYRYIQFAVANQFYMIANNAGLDFYRIVNAMKQDYPRARDFPGAGLAAGPCLFKDTMQLSAFSGNKFSFGHFAMLINEGMPFYIVERISQQHDLSRSVVGLLGMAFKAESDDRRSSLSYKLKNILKFRAKEVLITDDYITDDPELLPVEEVIRRSDILVLSTPHLKYKHLNTAKKPLYDIWDFMGQGGKI